MHGKTNEEIRNNTIKDILEEDIFSFIGSIGSLIDYYTALHPEIGTPVDLAETIRFMVEDVSKIAVVSYEEAKNFLEDCKNENNRC